MNEPYTDFLTKETKVLDTPFPAGMMECIEQFLATDTTRPPGATIYHDVFSSPLMFPLQRQTELAKMMEITQSISPRVVMEIGADKGGSLYHWCKSIPTVKRVIACEVRGTPYDALFEKAFPHIEFLWVEHSSYTPATVNNVKRWLGKDKIDVLFIDGDKSAFEEDFDCYLGLMNPAGIVFMHDIQDDYPGASFAAVRGRGYNTAAYIDTSDTVEAIRRERRGIEISCPHEGWLRHWKGQSCGLGVIYLR